MGVIVCINFCVYVKNVFLLFFSFFSIDLLISSGNTLAVCCPETQPSDSALYSAGRTEC